MRIFSVFSYFVAMPSFSLQCVRLFAILPFLSECRSSKHVYRTLTVCSLFVLLTLVIYLNYFMDFFSLLFAEIFLLKHKY